MPLSFRLVALWVMSIVIGTLMPFDFVQGAAHRVLQAGAYERQFDDFVLNVLMFVPLGAWAHHALCGRRGREITKLAMIVGGAFALSTIVELLQAMLPSRDSSLIDVLANTAGAAAGIAVDRTWGLPVSAQFSRWRTSSTRQSLAALIASFMVFALAASALLQARTRLATWSESYPLEIGNEPSGDRPWRGRVLTLQIADAATSAEDMRQFADGRGIHLPGRLLVDRRNSLPLGSQFPAAALARDIRGANAFTMRIVCATDDVRQYTQGPARIVTNSESPLKRNFTVGQEYGDLVVRLRTSVTGENGSRYVTRVPNVFSTTALRDVLITYDGATVHATVSGGKVVSKLTLTPGASLAQGIDWLKGSWRPTPAEQLPTFDRVYVAGMFVVPAMLIGLLARALSDLVGFSAAYVFAFAVLFELVLVAASGRSFSAGNVGANVMIGAMVFTTLSAALAKFATSKETAAEHGVPYSARLAWKGASR